MSKKQTLGKGLSALIGGNNTTNNNYQENSDVVVLEKTKAVNSSKLKPSDTKKNTPTKPTNSNKVEKKATVETKPNNEQMIGFMELSVDKLITGDFQPRKIFSEKELLELSSSIKASGIMQPLLVRPTIKNGIYEIVAGERRWRATKLAGLKTVPVVVREIPDNDVLEFALVENIQRKDLTVIEEATGYKRLIEEFGHTQEELSKTVGKSRSHIANLMRLLSLPEEVKQMLDNGDITMGHARALIGSENALQIAKKVVSDGLNVRQVERFVKLGGIEPVFDEKTYKIMQKDPDILELEQLFTQNLGLKVSIKDKGNKGEVVIKYENLSELDCIIRKVSS